MNTTESAIRRFKEHYGSVNRDAVKSFFGLKNTGYRELIRKVQGNIASQVSEEISEEGID